MTKLSLAAVAAFVAISAPAFAGDQDLSTLQADSGRYVATVPAAKAPARAQNSAFDAYAFTGSVPAQRNVRSNAAPFQGSNEATQYVTSY